MTTAGNEIEPQPVELADRRVRPPTGGMTALTRDPSGHPRVDDRMGDGQFPAREGGDPLGDLDEFACRARRPSARLEAAAAFGEDRVRCVDEDVRDLGVLDERLQGSQAADGRLHEGDQRRHRREVEFQRGFFEDRGDRGPHQGLALGRRIEGIEELGREARHEHAPHLAERRGGGARGPRP